jgi:hypothetical protein
MTQQMRIWVLGMIACCLLQGGLAIAAGGTLVNVYMDCTTEGDLVGNNFCFAAKEKLRASAGFRLVEEPPKIGIGVHLVSLDPDVRIGLEGASSVVAASLTVYTGLGSLEYYETTYIFDVGEERVGEMATTLLSHIDQAATDNRGFITYQRGLYSSTKK